jgi:hypothetical protein
VADTTTFTGAHTQPLRPHLAAQGRDHRSLNATAHELRPVLDRIAGGPAREPVRLLLSPQEEVKGAGLHSGHQVSWSRKVGVG